jgi:hypothetical protein
MPGCTPKADFDLAVLRSARSSAVNVLPKLDPCARRCADRRRFVGRAFERLFARAQSGRRTGWLYRAAPFAPDMTLGDALLTPTRLYVKSGLAAIARGGVKGLAHITGSGITGNLPRVLPHGLGCEVDLGSWTLLPVFRWLAQEAGLPDAEMLQTSIAALG